MVSAQDKKIINKNRRRIRFDPLLRHRRDTLEEQASQESYFIPVAYLVNVQLIACFGHTPIILLWVYVKNAERCQTRKVDTEGIVSVKIVTFPLKFGVWLPNCDISSELTVTTNQCCCLLHPLQSTTCRSPAPRH